MSSHDKAADEEDHLFRKRNNETSSGCIHVLSALDALVGWMTRKGNNRYLDTSKVLFVQKQQRLPVFARLDVNEFKDGARRDGLHDKAGVFDSLAQVLVVRRTGTPKPHKSYRLAAAFPAASYFYQVGYVSDPRHPRSRTKVLC
jgi:hypothetical protein